MFNVQQRGSGPFTANGNNIDRWFTAASGGTFQVNAASLTDGNRASIGDESAIFAHYNNFTGGSGATNYLYTIQSIEGVARLSNTTVTLSFWATVGSGSLKLGASLDQYFGSGGSPSPQSNGNGQAVTLTTTPTRYVLTFNLPSIAGKTLGTNGGDCTNLNFWYSSGANNAARAGNIGVQAGIIWYWGVQLEIGSQATPLEKPDRATELANCQRFYQNGSFLIAGWIGAANITVGSEWTFSVPMRATPTLTWVDSSTPGMTTTRNLIADSGLCIRTFGQASGPGGFIWAGTYSASADL